MHILLSPLNILMHAFDCASRMKLRQIFNRCSISWTLNLNALKPRTEWVLVYYLQNSYAFSSTWLHTICVWVRFTFLFLLRLLALSCKGGVHILGGNYCPRSDPDISHMGPDKGRSWAVRRGRWDPRAFLVYKRAVDLWSNIMLGQSHLHTFAAVQKSFRIKEKQNGTLTMYVILKDF